MTQAHKPKQKATSQKHPLNYTPLKWFLPDIKQHTAHSIGQIIYTDQETKNPQNP